MPGVGVEHTSPEVWYYIDVPQRAQLQLSTCDEQTDFDTALTIWAGTSLGDGSINVDDNPQDMGLDCSTRWDGYKLCSSMYEVTPYIGC